MGFSIARLGDRVTLSVDGQLVKDNRAEFQQLVREQLERDAREFVVDFAHAGYIDSAGLGALVAIQKAIHAHGDTLRLTNLNADLRELFAMTRLSELFDLGPPGPRIA